MADLIELDIVVRDKTLKASVSTVARLEREITKAQKAVDQNTISQARYNKILLSAKREYQALGVSSQKATAQIRKFASAQAQASKATNSFAAGLGLSGKGINRLGVGMQQAGYQVGDFAVQIQGGTNAAVALGQQGSQLLGIFGPAGALAGAGLAIASAFIAPMIKAKEAADQVGVSIEAVFDRIMDRSESIGKLLEVTFSGPLEVARQQFLGIEAVFNRLDKETLLSKLRADGSEVNVVLKELNRTFAENDKLITQGAKRTGGRSGIALSDKELNDLKDAQKAIVTFQADLGIALRGPTEDIAKGFVEAYATLQDMSSAVADGIAPEFKRLLEDTGLYAQYQEHILQAAKDQSEEARRQAREAAEFVSDAVSARDADLNAEEAILKAYNERLQSLNDVVTLNGAILRSENDQETVLNAKQAIQRNNLSIYIKEAKLTQDQAQALRRVLITVQDQEHALLKVAENTAQSKEEAKLFAAAMKEVLSAISKIDSFGLSLKDKLAKITASNEAIKQGLDGQIAGEIQLLKIQRERLTLGLDRDDILAKSTELRQIDDTIAAYEEQLKLNKKLTKSNKTGTKAVKDNRTAYEKAMMTAKEFADTLDKQVIGAVDSLSNAFSEFMQNGFRDFKGFVKSIGDMFLKLLADMAAAALKRQILIPIATGMAAGFGSSAAASTIGAGTGSFAAGTIGSSFAAGSTALTAGISTTLGMGTSTTGATAMAISPTMASIGAAIPYIVAIAAVIGLFTKKTKLLDSGLRTTVEGFDVAIETFKKTQTSRLFGLLKGSKKTAYEAASAEVADPLIEAIGNMQQSIVDAAGTLGIGASAFDDFSYQFKLSLKGLTEEEQLKKINEEITKMGDSFASLTGHFETMNELLEAANQRMQLQNRLDQLLGNNQAILTRQREAELSAMHELNRPLAQMVYNLEDAQASVQSAFASLGASIEAEKNRLRDAFTSIVDGLNKRLDVANETMARSNSIYSMLEGAVSGRSITSGIGQSLSRREGALGFIRGGDFSDERKLEEALDVVAEPSEGLFSSFVDYARDFARTSITLEEAKKVAQVQLTADEKSVLLLEQQIAQAQVDLDAQLEALDKQYQMEVDQYNALLGIDTSVKSVTEAIGTLKSAIEALASAQAAAKAAAAVGTAGAGTGAAAAGIKLTGEKYQGYDLGNIRGAADLMAAAAQNNIQTSGKTGAQIQQAISNATGLAINMDNATRGKQFAMGGYHTGGLRMVGERGPELEATGPSRIFSHNQTSGMFKDPDLKEAVNELRREVSGLRSEQRQMQASNAKYVKRNYDINRKWDVDGLPATRT